MRTKEITEGHLSLFPDESLNESSVSLREGSLNAPREPRRSPKSYAAYKSKGKEPTSREKRNRELWTMLYPTPKR